MAPSRTSQRWKTLASGPMFRCRIGKSAMRSGRPPTSAMKRRRIRIAVCKACPVKGQCTTSTQGRRVYRYVGEEYLERVRTYHHTPAYQKAMNKRKVWVEPLFAEAKDWHGLRRFRLRLLWRVNIEALRIATGQNLKRLLKKRGWGRRPFPTEAFCASFLAAFGWFARPSLRYASVSSFIGSHCPVNRWSISHLTDEFCGRVFQQAGTDLKRIGRFVPKSRDGLD